MSLSLIAWKISQGSRRDCPLPQAAKGPLPCCRITTQPLRREPADGFLERDLLIASLFRLFIKGRGHGIEELVRRLDMSLDELRALRPSYREFSLPKRSGGRRRILAPDEPLKTAQRRILRRLLGRLTCHQAAMGFEKGRSIVTNARLHVAKAVVLKMDLNDFFPSTDSRRVRRYFRKIGWNREVANLLVRLCTYNGGLPQGAPTSPRLSNLVNYRLDARLTGLAAGRWFRNPSTGARVDEHNANGSYKRCGPHAWAGQNGLPHYQPDPRPPMGHTFYETAKRHAL